MEHISIVVMFRFDTEDYATSESNDALKAIADTMNERGIRATFPIVGEKARFLKREGRSDVIRALRPHALGFHTHRHSAHPTLPELVESLSWDEALSLLDETERPGVEAVAEVFGRPPLSYTQAGGTWLPHSHALIARWGIPFFYTETWNSYLDVVGTPYRLADTAGLTSPVTVMRPFDLASEGREEAARSQIEAALQTARQQGGGMLGFVAHPTELVTTGDFWDIINFGYGTNHVPPEGPYRKPQLKARQQVVSDLRAFADLLDYIAGEPDVEIIAIDEYQERLAAAGAAEGAEPLIGRADGGLPTRTRWASASDWLRLSQAFATGACVADDRRTRCSALEALALLGALLERAAEGGSADLGLDEALTTLGCTWGPAMGDVRGRRHFTGDPSVGGGLQAWRDAWREVSRAKSGEALPPTCEICGRRAPIGSLLSALAQIVCAAIETHPDVDPAEALQRLEQDAPLRMFAGRPIDPAAQGIKAMERLHWDWPIFAPGARFDRCYELTRSLMWTFARLADPVARPGLGLAQGEGARAGHGD